MNIKKFKQFSLNESVSIDYLKSMFSIIKDYPIEYLLNGQLTIGIGFPPNNDKGYSSCKDSVKYYENLAKLWKDIESIVDQIEMDGYDVLFANRHGSIGVSITKDKEGSEKKFNSNLFVKFKSTNNYEEEFYIDEEQLKEFCELHGLIYKSYTVEPQKNGSLDYDNYEVMIYFDTTENSKLSSFVDKLIHIDNCQGKFQVKNGAGFELGNEYDTEDVNLVYKPIS